MTIHKTKNGSVAQWIEHGFSKPRVTGSNPVGITKRSIEVMVTCPTVSWAPRVRFSHRPQGFTEKFSSGCLPETELEVNLKNWKDNGGCLPALDAGGHRFESYFPDTILLHSSNGQDACLSSRQQGFDSLMEYKNEWSMRMLKLTIKRIDN